MLDYARQRAVKALSIPRKAVLVTSGPAGLQASEFPCQAIDLDFYLLVPKISDHLFNLEHNSTVTLLAAGWELNGQAQILDQGGTIPRLNLLGEPCAEWCLLVRVEPHRLQIRREEGWGNIETIDLES